MINNIKQQGVRLDINISKVRIVSSDVTLSFVSSFTFVQKNIKRGEYDGGFIRNFA